MNIEQNRILSKFKILIFFVKEFPFYSFFLLIALFIVGFLEAIGILGLLPLIEIILNENDTSSIGKNIKLLITSLGFESTMFSILFFIILVFLIKAIIQLFLMYRVSHITSRVAHDFRSSFLRNLINANWKFFLSQPNGRFVNSMLIEAPKAATCIVAICRVLESFIRVIMLLIAASITNLEISFFAIIAGAVLAISMKKFLSISFKTSEKTVFLQNKLSVSLTEILQNVKAMKVMNFQDRLIDLMDNQSFHLYIAYAIQTFAKNCISILREPIIVIFIVGGFLYMIEKKVSMSEILIIAAIFYRIVNSWGLWQSSLQTLIVNETYFWSFRSILDKAIEQKEILLGNKIFELKNKITFKNVYFGYNDFHVLKKFNCTIKAKQMNVFTGPSGVGKSSIIDLLTCLHVPESGEIKIDNVNINEIKISTWRNSLGYVGQENFLFNDTLRSNILLGREDISDKKIWDILKIVEAYEFVNNFEKKLDTSVGERGLKMSGGQRQRIFIARALIRDPQILILDEATVGLEENIEEKICKNLKLISKSITIIAITHQKALLRNADNLFNIKKI